MIMMMATMTSSSTEGVLHIKNALRFPLYTYSIEFERDVSRGCKSFARRFFQWLWISECVRVFTSVYFFFSFFHLILFSFSTSFLVFIFTLFRTKLRISNIYNAQIHYKLLRIHENEMDQLWWIGLRIRKRAKYLLFI